jgi:thioredoxin reductase (NADPH)
MHEKQANPEIWDIIILGGGPAGLTAGLYAARGDMTTLLIEKMVAGGQAATTEWVDNYPGFPEGIGGPELSNMMEEHAVRFGLQMRNEAVLALKSEDGDPKTFRIKTDQGRYRGLAVIIALGTEWSKLGVDGEERLRGLGVSYCATCDAPFFRDQDVVVVGGGDTAVEEGTYLAKMVNKVSIVHRRDRLRASQVIQQRAFANPKIEFIWDTVVEAVEGEEAVERLRLRDVKTGKTWHKPCAGVFIFVGQIPNTQILRDTVATDEWGYILTDDRMRTSVEGIFACGDVRQKLLRQIVTACGDGATAAFAAQQYVEQLKGTAYD